MKTIKIASTAIDIYEDGPVGVSVSGGADSALLLFILMTHVKEHIHIYNIIEPIRILASDKPFDETVSECARLTGNTNYTIHKQSVNTQSPETWSKFLKSKLDSGEIDIIYAGLSNFPPEEVYKDWADKQPNWHAKTRSDQNIKPVFGITFEIDKETDFTWLTENGEKTDALVVDERVYVPFINLNKRATADMYHELNLVDTLYPKTRSCETEDHPGSHCGHCFWCLERKWAFGFL